MDCVPLCKPYIPPRNYDVPSDSDNLLLLPCNNNKKLNIKFIDYYSNKNKCDLSFFIILFFFLVTLLYKFTF